MQGGKKSSESKVKRVTWTSILKNYFIIIIFFTLQYCIGFAIHQHESANKFFLNCNESSLPASDLPFLLILNYSL